MEMPGPWKAWKSKSSFSPLSTALGNLAKGARFPHSHSLACPGWESGKPKSGFPLSHAGHATTTAVCLFSEPKTKKGDRPASRPPQSRFSGFTLDWKRNSVSGSSFDWKMLATRHCGKKVGLAEKWRCWRPDTAYLAVSRQSRGCAPAYTGRTSPHPSSRQAGVCSAATRLCIRLLRLMTPGGDLSVHSIRCQIDLAWPRDGAVIDENLLEKLRILQRRERTRQIFPPQLHTPRQSVFELDKEAAVRLRLHFNDVPIHRTIPRSRQWLNLRWGLFSRQQHQASSNSCIIPHSWTRLKA